MLGDTFPRQRTLPTLAWAGAGTFALILSQIVGVLAYVVTIRLTQSGQFLSTHSLLHSGQAVTVSTVLSTAAVIPFLWVLTRIRTQNVAEYLALCWPARRQVVISVIAFAVFMAAQVLVAHWWESSSDMKFMQDMDSSARAAHAIPLLIAAVVVAAPVGEELVFRGFLYRTLELRFGGIAAIVVTALGWAVLHIQYSLVGITVIFAGGLLFGAIRRYSGSLYLTMLMHTMWNGLALTGALLMNGKV
jgi:hypothetical protein